jgi:hypothetical protein
MLIHKYIEKDVSIENNLLKYGDYFRDITPQQITINNYTHTFDKVRFFDLSKKYLKTINIIKIGNVRLEDEDFYLSFSTQNEDLNIFDDKKYSYGVFSKKHQIKDDKNVLKIIGNGIKKDYENFDPKFNIIYSKKFLETFPDSPYIGLNTNPNNFGIFTFYPFIVKNNLNSNSYLFEKTEIYDSIPIPSIYLRLSKEIFEDDEILINI